MIMNFYNNIGQSAYTTAKNVTFCGKRNCAPDCEVSSENYTKKDMIQKIVLKNAIGHSDIEVEFDPLKTGALKDRNNGENIDVYIMKHEGYNDEDADTFFFVSKDLKKVYGYVELNKNYLDKSYDEDIQQDYPEYGIYGNRVIVDWLKNKCPDEVSGVGTLADMVAVRYCKENNIEPNILSYCAENSHAAHFKRGKRFIQPEKYSDDYEFLKEKYGSTNPNKILKTLFKQSNRTGKKIDTDNWGPMVMYMPPSMFEKYSEEE